MGLICSVVSFINGTLHDQSDIVSNLWPKYKNLVVGS